MKKKTKTKAAGFKLDILSLAVGAAAAFVLFKTLDKKGSNGPETVFLDGPTKTQAPTVLSGYYNRMKMPSYI